MINITENLKSVTDDLKEGVRLVAISKFHPAENILEAYQAGQRVFGESHVQELVAKQQTLPDDIEWHFIGHLQTNKVKYIAPFISLIHAVDTPKLMWEIDKQGQKNNRVLHCLLELHIATEETKYGFSYDELISFLESGEWKSMNHVSVDGLMCMATNTDDEDQIRGEFHLAKSIFDEVKQRFFAEVPSFQELSMGMSHDFETAIEEGATHIRVGTAIFGERDYSKR